MFLLPVCTWCYSPKSDYVSIGGTGSGMPENCVVAAYIRFLSVLFSSRHQLIITSGLRPPYWIYKCRKCTTWLMWVRLKKIANENHWNLVCSWHKTWNTAGGKFTPPRLQHTLKKHTCNRRVNLDTMNINIFIFMMSTEDIRFLDGPLL